MACPYSNRMRQAAACLRCSRHGFTLVELLVVIAIIAVLIAITLPALGKVLGAMRATACLSHQRQLMVGWSTAMAENKGQIPYLLPTKMPPDSENREIWWGLLAEQFPDLEQPVYKRAADAHNVGVCPIIDTRFSRPFYGSVLFGYSINARWSGCGPVGESERRRWSTIPSPSTYPWFADPAVEDLGIYATNGVFGRPNAPDWGLGFYHTGGKGNAVFADGHAESYRPGVLEDTGDCTTPTWFLAEKRR